MPDSHSTKPTDTNFLQTWLEDRYGRTFAQTVIDDLMKSYEDKDEIINDNERVFLTR